MLMTLLMGEIMVLDQVFMSSFSSSAFSTVPVMQMNFVAKLVQEVVPVLVRAMKKVFNTILIIKSSYFYNLDSHF